ncbi:MAG: hypothetical protein WBE28_11830 [bacterium]
MNRYVKMATVEGHNEQAYVAERLARYKAGTRMYFSKTTPESLAALILQYMGKRVNYRSIPTDGAQRAAQIMNRFLV